MKTVAAIWTWLTGAAKATWSALVAFDHAHPRIALFVIGVIVGVVIRSVL